MNTSPRRILGEAERAREGRPRDADPVADPVVFYLDRLTRNAKFDQRLFSALFETLDGRSRLALGKALYGANPPAEAASVMASGRRGRGAGDLYPDSFERLEAVITSSWDFWDTRSTVPVPESQVALDPGEIEKATLKAFRSCHGGRDLADPFEPCRERLGAIFGLSRAEAEILVFLWCFLCDDSFRFAVDRLSLADYHRYLADCIGVEAGEVKKLMASSSRLVQMGFVMPDYMPPPHYGLGDEMRHFFTDPESLHSFVIPLERYLGETAKKNVPMESFPVPPLGRGIVEVMLRAGNANILVHGAPGTGKTTFVTRLALSMGVPAFILSAMAGSEDGRPPFIRLKVASHLARGAHAILIIDEADNIINTEARKPDSAGIAKAWLTEFMDYHSGSIVWIANDIDNVHDAIKRRFAYSLEFKPQNERQRALLWQDLVRGYGFEGTIGQTAIESLSKRHEVTAGGIDIALRGLRTVMSAGGEGGGPLVQGDPVGILSEILSRHEALMTGMRPLSPPRPVRGDPRYLPEAINVDMPLGELVSALGRVASGIKVRQELAAMGGGAAAAAVDGAGREVLEAKLLFAGGPGTGKTAYARWLAEALGLPLVQKRGSDLLSALVGGTEQLIAAAFEEAEDAGAILLLDEADSLFLDRSKAERSWERSQTNELLTRMEAYSGILICCTNRMEDFDSASLRRFQWKLAFKPPRAEQRTELYRRYFTEICGEPDEATLRAIRDLEGLCPGDFAAVHKAFVPLAAAMPASTPASGAVTHARVIERLRSELGCRAGRSAAQRRIGFA